MLSKLVVPKLAYNKAKPNKIRLKK